MHFVCTEKDHYINKMKLRNQSFGKVRYMRLGSISTRQCSNQTYLNFLSDENKMIPLKIDEL